MWGHISAGADKTEVKQSCQRSQLVFCKMGVLGSSSWLIPGSAASVFPVPTMPCGSWGMWMGLSCAGQWLLSQLWSKMQKGTTSSYLLGLGLMFLRCCWHAGASKTEVPERPFPASHWHLMFLAINTSPFTTSSSSSRAQLSVTGLSFLTSPPHLLLHLRNAAPVNFSLLWFVCIMGIKWQQYTKGFILYSGYCSLNLESLFQIPLLNDRNPSEFLLFKEFSLTTASFLPLKRNIDFYQNLLKCKSMNLCYFGEW